MFRTRVIGISVGLVCIYIYIELYRVRVYHRRFYYPFLIISRVLNIYFYSTLLLNKRGKLVFSRNIYCYDFSLLFFILRIRRIFIKIKRS